MNEVLARIARDDLTIASALIDVRVLRDGDSLILDFSRAAKTAEVTLTAAKAGRILESEFGLTPGGSYGDSGPEDQNSRNGATMPPAAVTGEASLMEAIAARLGADILMSRRLDAEDNGAGDIEDEQF